MLTEPSITNETSVAELVDHWLTHLRAEGRLEDATINEYERVLRKLVVPELGDLPLRGLTTNRIDEFLDGLAGLSVDRRRKAKVVTGAMLELAIGFGVLETNPVRGTVSVVRPKTARPPLTVAEVETVRAAVCAWMTADRPGPKASTDMADSIHERCTIYMDRYDSLMIEVWQVIETGEGTEGALDDQDHNGHRARQAGSRTLRVS